MEPAPADAAEVFTPAGLELLAGMRDTLAALDDFGPDAVEQALRDFAQARGVKMKAIVHPLRLACTGSRSGPSLFHLLAVLGRGRVIERIDRALARAAAT